MNDREKELLFGGKVNAQIESVLNSKVLTHKEKDVLVSAIRRKHLYEEDYTIYELDLIEKVNKDIEEPSFLNRIAKYFR